MDTWFFYDVIHGLHTYCNPTSEETVRELEAVLELNAKTRVLDIASGLGEMLVGFAERYGVSGVGVDISPFFIPRAEARKAARAPDADITFVEMPAEEYEPDEPFDLAMCIGASWIWNGCEGTLKALKEFVKPGGLIVTGEPFWKEEPPAAYLEIENLKREEFPTLSGYFHIARRLGLSVLWMRQSSPADWDRYEMLQTASVDRFEREHPDHPDLPAIREKLLPDKDAYLRWGKDCLGFAFWVFRKPAA